MDFVAWTIMNPEAFENAEKCFGVLFDNSGKSTTENYKEFFFK